MHALIVAFAILAFVPQAGAGTPAPGFTDTAYVSGLTSPTAIAFVPDGTLLIPRRAAR